jgi:hypothetical protein
MRRRGAYLAGTLTAVVLAAPAASQAAVSNIGSDLSGSAAVAIQRTQDTALAQLQAPGGGPTAPQGGQVLAVRVAGCSQHDNVPQAPETRLFAQVLQPQGDGSNLVVSSSQPFDLPICGRAGADHGTLSTFSPSDQCISRGDRVGVVVGGQTPGYPNGTQYFIARSSPGASLGAFSGNGQTVNGSRFTLAPLADTELLMQAAIGSGADSPSGCTSDAPEGGGGGGGGGGGSGGTGPTAASLVVAKPATATRRGKATVAIGCKLPAGDTCRFALVLFRGKARIGTVAGAVPGGEARALPLRLNKAGRAALRRGRLAGTLRGTVRGHGGKATVALRLTVTRGR